MEDIHSLKTGDTILVKCNVYHVFPKSQIVCVGTRDCNEGFDVYSDEIIGVLNNNSSEELKETIINNSFTTTNPCNTYKEIQVIPVDKLFNILGLDS